MTMLSYRDFDVRLARLRQHEGETVFDVWVEGVVPAGEMRPDDATTVPFDEGAFWDHPTTLFGGPAGRLEDDRVEERHLRQLGGMLGALALPDGPVQQLFRESIKLQRQAGEGLRLRLHIDPVELTRLPWEFITLADDHDAPTDFLALREEVSVVRTATVGTTALSLPQRGSVNVIGVLSSPESTDEIQLEDLDLEKDRRAISLTDTLLNTQDPIVMRRWVEDPASRVALRHTLLGMEGVDIFHFGGHGAFDLASQEGVLYMEADDGPDPLPASELAVLLRTKGVRLAVLGACESSVGTKKNAWSGVAQALTRQGLPAVVGNQLAIRDDLAAELFFELYTRILGGETVDQALANARIAMMNEAGLEARDWGSPTLFLHERSGVLFPMPDPKERDASRSPFVRVSQSVGAVRGTVTGAKIGRISRGEVQIDQVVEDVQGRLIGLRADTIGEGSAASVGQEVEADEEPDRDPALVDVGQRVRDLSGDIVGVTSNIIHGDVSVTQLEVQVYARPLETRADLLAPAAAPERPPYPGAVPFAFEDRHLFFGRDTLSDELLAAVNDHPVVLMHGPAGSGKTSLLNARLLPQLTSRGALTVRLEDYIELGESLHQGLAAAAEGLGLHLTGETSLPSLAAQIIDQSQGTFLLVLDEFERLFDLPESRQRAALGEIAAVVDEQHPLLRVLVVYRSDDGDSFARLTRFRRAIGDRIGREIEVRWLDHDEAGQAIREPARRHGGVVYAPVSLIDRIVADLDALSATRAPGEIEPFSLQVVCQALYEQARTGSFEGGFAVVNEDNYQGAEFIVGRYLTELLTAEFAGVEEVARKALHDLTLVDTDPWLAADEIDAPPATPEEARAVLDRMSELGLVIRRTSEPFEYSLANPAIRAAAERYAGTVDFGHVNRTLEALWYGWITTARLADQGQLAFLAEARQLETILAQDLFLLASAVDSGTDVVTWRDRIRDHSAELEALERDDAIPPMRRALEQLVGDPPPMSGVGIVTAGAVGGAKATARDTAALALTAVEDYPARIQRGLSGIDGSWSRRRRRADIWSVVAEANGVAVIDEFRTSDRVAIWFRRVGRRLTRHRIEFTRLSIFTSLLAALFFGLYQVVLGTLTQAPLVLEFLVTLWWGLLFSAGASVAALTGRFGVVKPGAWKTIAAGAVGFTVVNLLVTAATGVDPFDRPTTTLLALVAGASLVWILSFDVPSRGQVALATIGAAVVLAGVHIVVQTIGEPREAMQIVHNSSFFAAELPLQGSFFEDRSPQFFRIVSVIDAAAAGATIAFGIALGARLGIRRSDADLEKGDSG